MKYQTRKIRHILFMVITMCGTLASAACKEKSQQNQEVVFSRTNDKANRNKNHKIQKDTYIKEKTENSSQHARKGDATPEQLMLLDKAKTAQRIGKIGDATAYYEKLLETSPLSPQKESATIALSQIYRENGNSLRATKLLEALNEQDPDLPEGYFLLGRAYAADRETEKAISMYEKLLEKQPDYLVAMIELGALYNLNGDKTKLVDVLKTYESKVYHYAKVAEDENAELDKRKYALDVLSLVSDERATKAVYRALMDIRPEIRYQALTVISDDDPEEKILRRVDWISKNDSEYQIRMLAQETLKTLKAKKSVKEQ